MNISLPEPIKLFLDGQISTSRYSSAGKSVREFIRADEKRKAKAQLEAGLLANLNGAENAQTLANLSAIRKEAMAKGDDVLMIRSTRFRHCTRDLHHD
jgi:Arc/MetJ-type ribon-helix-helix transcriptional regulator